MATRNQTTDNTMATRNQTRQYNGHNKKYKKNLVMVGKTVHKKISLSVFTASDYTFSIFKLFSISWGDQIMYILNQFTSRRSEESFLKNIVT
jgi:hypothetical protein